MNLTINGDSRRWEGTPTVRTLLDDLVRPEVPVAVAVNGAFVPRSRHGDTALEEGDEVEILSPQQGG